MISRNELMQSSFLHMNTVLLALSLASLLLISSYHSRPSCSSKPYHRIRLMVVGDSNKGKTTLVMNLSKKYLVRRQKKLRLDLDERPLSTEGVDILDWEYRKGGKSQTTVTFYTWDFGGQVCGLWRRGGGGAECKLRRRVSLAFHT